MDTAATAEKRIEQIVKSPHLLSRMFRDFFHAEATGSIVLLAATVLALLWANSPWADVYFTLLHTEIAVHIGPYNLILDMHELVNDGLMVIFFLVVGLEIKREVVVGELSSAKRAILPVAAAVGGMLLPALIYVAVNAGKVGMEGWGIPMATDIAFALGILALLGSRVPPTLKVFLTALAIADDIGAVLVIALFYTAEVHWVPLAIAGILLLFIIAAGRIGIRSGAIYVILGFGVWLAILLSGVHATTAGILVALTVPVRARMDPEEFLTTGYTRLEELSESELTTESMIHDHEQLETITELHDAARSMQPVGLMLEEYFHPILVWMVLPLFAFFNAGVQFSGRFFDALFHPVSLGIILGLVIGKQLGITLFAWLAVRIGQATLPEGVNWRLVYGASWLAGIGFTMSLFVAGLAFSDATLVSIAKVGILAGSLICGVFGYLLLRFWLPDEGQESLIPVPRH